MEFSESADSSHNGFSEGVEPGGNRYERTSVLGISTGSKGDVRTMLAKWKFQESSRFEYLDYCRQHDKMFDLPPAGIHKP